MTSTTASAQTATETKIAARIMATADRNPSMTFREVVTETAAEAVNEARRKGWSDRTITGMVHVIAQVGADMVAAAVAAS